MDTAPSWAVITELHVVHGVNATYKLQDLLQQPGLELASMGMPDQRTAYAATQGIIYIDPKMKRGPNMKRGIRREENEQRKMKR